MKIPIISKWLEKRNNTSDLLNPRQWLYEALGVKRTLSGVSVNEDSAMRHSAVYACVRIIAETIASLPVFVYERLETGKNKAIEHPLYDVLHSKANEEMSAFSYKETICWHILLTGNSESLIVKNRNKDVISLYPYQPKDIKIEILDGRAVFKNGSEQLDKRYLLHIPGLSFNGVIGKSPIGYMREAIGLGMALEQFGSTFFSNGTNIGGVAKHPGKLSKQGHDNLIDSINKAYQGLGNSHKLMLLEENMDFMPVTMPLADAQYIELRRFQLEEIARIFRVPLHLLQDLSRSTNNNIEHQSIDFVMHTIRPWLVRIEQAINMQLFSEQERRKYFVEFSVDALLRGDILSRFQAYSIAKQNGIFNANEIRELENRNPYEGGDKYTIQLNMQDVEQLGKLVGDNRELVIKDNEIRVVPVNNTKEIVVKPVEANSNERVIRSIRSANTRTRLAKAYSGLFENVITRLIRRERAEVISIANSCFINRDNQLFGEKLDKFYEDFKEFLNTQTKPVISTYADAIALEAADEVELKDYDIDKFTDRYQKAFDYRYSNEHKGRITNIVTKAIENNKDPIEVLEKEFDSWEEKKPEQVSKEETVKIAGAVSLVVYKSAGITKLIWINTGSKSCPYCEELDGKVVGIEESFVPVGSQFKPDGAESPLKIDSPKMHAPLHNGCVCQISPSW